jgi:hypothetical protein
MYRARYGSDTGPHAYADQRPDSGRGSDPNTFARIHFSAGGTHRYIRAPSSYSYPSANTDFSTYTHTGPDVSGQGSQDPNAATDGASGATGHGRDDRDSGRCLCDGQ